MAPPSTVVETTCSAATRPVTVAGSMVCGCGGWRRSDGEMCQDIFRFIDIDLYDYQPNAKCITYSNTLHSTLATSVPVRSLYYATIVDPIVYM